MTKIQRNPAQRQGEIKRLLLARGALSVEELCALVSASPATIRRDLTLLQEPLGIERTHGGATVQALRPAEQHFAAREAQDVAEKRAIAEAALALIEPGSTIFMNDGSSIMAIAKAIVASGIELFVATPAVNVAAALSENPKATVCLLGGFVRQTSLATSGPFAEAMVAQINADLALISPDGLSAESGLTFTHASDAALAKCMSDKAQRTVAIAVGAKLRRTERIGALPLSAVSEIITGMPGRRPAAGAAQARRDADPGRGRRKRRVSLARARGNLTGALFVGPAFCYILLVVIYPLFYSLWASFTNMRLTSPLTSFVGLDTYAQALSSEIFQDSLAVTALFLVSVVALEFILGFALAYSFSRMAEHASGHARAPAAAGDGDAGQRGADLEADAEQRFRHPRAAAAASCGSPTRSSRSCPSSSWTSGNGRPSCS